MPKPKIDAHRIARTLAAVKMNGTVSERDYANDVSDLVRLVMWYEERAEEVSRAFNAFVEDEANYDQLGAAVVALRGDLPSPARRALDAAKPVRIDQLSKVDRSFNG